ncbi:MAG: DUF885 domain-containing protein [Gemmatimonadaceae bacterium]|jgi:uncharacterized protein (DUF885 family)|nr:DUF885 domain-containing protein [Gemmatimonadaceae bacterium]
MPRVTVRTALARDGARRRAVVAVCGVLTLAAMGSSPLAAQARGGRLALPSGVSELRDTVELFSSDRSALLRRWHVEYSPTRRDRLKTFYSDWRSRLRRVDFDKLSQEGRIDYVLLDHRLRAELARLDREQREAAEMAARVPFAPAITQFVESWRAFEKVDAPQAGRTLSRLALDVDSLTRGLRVRRTDSITRAERIVALRAIGWLSSLQGSLRDWHRFYGGYDPTFTWWTADPYRRANESMTRYARALREEIVGQREGQEEPIIGDPIGAAGLAEDLEAEMIAYTPADLIALAEREFAWIEGEQKKAARDMGFGDDWRAALEAVKQAYVPPGEQPELVRRLAREAVAFVTEKQLVTVPPLADEIWRMQMMPPRQQLVSPFFLGGEVIQIAYPTDSMAHDDKLMSLRGNNPYFSKATVHHELIPGHHLQGFMTQRYATHRSAFNTPFWTEGWALWWEMLLWDQGFATTPQERMGMLFWRSHRLARIIFSLKVHLGEMTPQQAIDMLVNRVGHERANAEAEVRRSFNGSYSPLYQAAYMLGGLQLRALHRELVGGGRMTNTVFHDTILQGGRIPIEMVRARLLGTPLTRDYRAQWKFITP